MSSKTNARSLSHTTCVLPTPSSSVKTDDPFAGTGWNYYCFRSCRPMEHDLTIVCAVTLPVLFSVHDRCADSTTIQHHNNGTVQWTDSTQACKTERERTRTGDMLFKTLAITALAAAPLADGFVTPFAANTAFKGNAVATRVSFHLGSSFLSSICRPGAAACMWCCAPDTTFNAVSRACSWPLGHDRRAGVL